MTVNEIKRLRRGSLVKIKSNKEICRVTGVRLAAPVDKFKEEDVTIVTDEGEFGAFDLIVPDAREQVCWYIKDPDTRVRIRKNTDTGVLCYSVEVADCAFWLDSFKTEKGATSYIRKNGLKLAP